MKEQLEPQDIDPHPASGTPPPHNDRQRPQTEETLSLTTVVTAESDPYANTAPGTIAYAKSEGPDGIATYTPVIAQETYYQTPSGPVRGIKWVMATRSQAVAAGIPFEPITASDSRFSNDLPPPPLSTPSTATTTDVDAEPGTISYITAKDPDGAETYLTVIAQETYYQTPLGLARGIHWVPVTPSQAATAAAGILPSLPPIDPITSTMVDQAPSNDPLSELVTSTMSCADLVDILAKHGCVDLTLSLDKSTCSKYPVTSGGLGDVYYGRLLDNTPVAIKTIRAYYDPGQLARVYHKRVAKEIYTWLKCKHPNVVQLLGSAVFHDCLAMISRWEENGSLLHYLSRHPSTDRCQLSLSICAGLAYLHDNDIVHGDLKGANVLISQNGMPTLMDFGNASLLESTLRFTQTSTSPSYSIQWMAPEILGGTSSYTTAADVYSLGMTILEAFTSDIPFADRAERSLHVHIVVLGKIPTRPEKVIPRRSPNGDKLWGILEQCWSYVPTKRPNAALVYETMKSLTFERLWEVEGDYERGSDGD